MEKRLRIAGFAALLLVVAALAYAPLATAGFVGEDLPFLVRASGSAGGELRELSEKLAEGDGPLARLSLAISWRLWAGEGAWGLKAARLVRLENLLLLLGAAACARLALRRALAPWTGMDGARAAAGACALILACHPLCVPAVAWMGARGDLLAALLSAAGAALFLRGRQERRLPEMAGAAVCALLAGHASALALCLPVLLCALELFCARRSRPVSVRLRTAATTLLVFGACVSAEALTGPALGSPALWPRALRSAAILFEPGRFEREGVLATLRSVAADLGRVALPVPQAILRSSPDSGPGSGALAPILAGALLLLALQPALVAARSAPRLWGWLATLTCTSLLVLLLGRVPLAHGDAGLSGALGLLPAAAVASAALAVASTALSGPRRVLIPAALAAAFAVFARATTAPWVEASRALGELQADLGAARAHHIGEARFLVVDPPGRVAGLEVAGPALPLIFDPSLAGRSAAGSPVRERTERDDIETLRGISRDALLAFSREPEFAMWRRRSLVLLLPAGMTARREVLVVPPPKPSNETLSWQGDLRSPLLDVDPLEKRALRAQALPKASTAEAPRLGWRAGEADTRSQTGVWIEGAEGPVAFFDLSRSTDWLFGSRVHRAWLEPEIGRIASAVLLSDVPAWPGTIEPLKRAECWVFEVPAALSKSLPRPLHGEARFVLALLDVRALRYVEIPAQAGPDGEFGGEVIFPLARAREEGIQLEGGPLAWSFELRAGAACISRAAGRR